MGAAVVGGRGDSDAVTAMDWHHFVDTVLLPILLALLAVGAGSGTSIFLFRRQQHKADEEIKKIHVETSLLPMEAQDRHQLAQANTLGQLVEVLMKTIAAMRQRLDDMNQDYIREHTRAEAAEQLAQKTEAQLRLSQQREAELAGQKEEMAVLVNGYKQHAESAEAELVKVNTTLAELKSLFELCSEELKDKVSQLMSLNQLIERQGLQINELTRRMNSTADIGP